MCALAASRERGLDPESPLYAAVSVLLLAWDEDEPHELSRRITDAVLRAVDLVIELDRADHVALTTDDVPYGSLARMEQLHAAIGDSLDGLKGALVA